MTENKDFPSCSKADCAACNNGRCIALISNDFGGRECPFYKTKEQNEKELTTTNKEE